jgi:hypothetical protein
VSFTLTELGFCRVRCDEGDIDTTLSGDIVSSLFAMSRLAIEIIHLNASTIDKVGVPIPARISDVPSWDAETIFL